MKKLSFLASFLTISALFCSYSSFCQQSVTKYFDVNWGNPTTSDTAYYAVFVPEGDLYNCTAYYVNSDKIKSHSFQHDTIMGLSVGLMTAYYESGQLEDSIYVGDKTTTFFYHYYEDGRLNAKFVKGSTPDKNIVEGFDEKGKKIKNFIFEREAEFKGGKDAWAKYISRKGKLPREFYEEMKQKGLTNQKVTAIMAFTIDEEGKIDNVKDIRSSGYKVIDDIYRDLLINSPEWVPAVRYNKPMKAYRVQPISFVL